MKIVLAALAVAAIAATPAMAQTYRAPVRAAAPGYMIQGDTGYGAYAYVPGAYGPGSAWGTGIVFEAGRYAGADPDPNVRLQLQNQANITDR